MSSEEESGAVGGIAYHVVAIVFGILASTIVLAFSRHREYRADAGSAQLLGADRMIAALKKLQMLKDSLVDDTSGKGFSTMKISDKPSPFFSIFSSHPLLKTASAR